MKKLLLIISILILNSNIALAANNLISADWWKTATLDKVKTEIANGSDVNASGTDRAGNGDLRTNVTPLMFALKYGKPSVEVIETLIKAGANVNTKENTVSLTPLIYASLSTQNPKIINVLIKAGADINARDMEGDTALMKAALASENPEIIKTLIKAGADVNIQDNNGVTALMIATGANENPEITKTLIKAGADVNVKAKNNLTALLMATRYNNSEKIKELIAAGADMDVVTIDNNNRMTALSMAFIQHSSEVWKYLAKEKTEEFCELTNSNSGEVLLCEDKVNLYLKKEAKLQNCATNIMAVPYITKLLQTLLTAEDPNKTVMAMIGLGIEFNCSISAYMQSAVKK